MGVHTGTKWDDTDYAYLTEGEIAEKKEFVNGVLDEIFQADVDFYLQTLKDLSEQGEVSYIGATEIIEPYVGLSESGARLNFILKLVKAGIATQKTEREEGAGAYRHHFKIAENYREAVKERLNELEE